MALLFLPEELADAKETQSAVEAEGRTALLLPGNITDVRFCHEAVQRTVDHFGKLDILVNNAAFQQHQSSLDQLTDEQWDLRFVQILTAIFT